MSDRDGTPLTGEPDTGQPGQVNDPTGDEPDSSLSSDSDQESGPDEDAVGDTAFSKHFLFTTLMNTIKVMVVLCFKI